MMEAMAPFSPKGFQANLPANPSANVVNAERTENELSPPSSLALAVLEDAAIWQSQRA